MAIGRQVASAYIDIHGDLAPFRRELDKAGLLVQNFGKKMKGLGGLNVLEDSFRYGIQFMQNIDRNSVQLAKMVTLIGSVAAETVHLAGAAAVISQDIAALGGVGLLAPAFLTGFGIALGVTIAALKDMKVVLKDLAPQFAQLQNSISKEFWSQAEQPIRRLVESLMPTLQTQLKATAKAMGGLFAEFADALRTEATPERVTGMFEKLNRAIDISRGAIKPFTAALVTLGEHGSKYFERFGSAIVDVSNKFNDFIQRSNENGDLDKWTERAIQGFKDLGRILSGAVGIVNAIGDAARAAGVGGLKEMGDRLQAASDIMNSPRFQNALRMMFEGVREVTDGIVAGIGKLGPALEAAMPTIKNVLGNIGTAMESIGGILAGIVSNPEFLAGFERFSEAIVTSLDKLAPAVEPFAKSLGGLLELMSKVLEATAELVGNMLVKLGPVLDKFGDKLSELVDPLSETLNGLIDQLVPIFESLYEQVLVPVVDIIAKDLLPIVGKLAEALGPTVIVALEEIGQLLRDIAPLFSGINKELDPSKGKTFADTLRTIIQGFEDVANWRPLSGMSIWQWLDSQPVKDFNKTVNTELSNFWGDLAKNVETINATVNRELGNFWRDLGNGWHRTRMEAQAGVAQLNDAVNQGLEDMWGGFAAGWADGFKTFNADVNRWFTELWTNFQNGINEGAAGINQSVNSFFGDLWNGFMEGWNTGFAQFNADVNSMAADIWQGFVDGLLAGALGLATWIIEGFTGWVNDLRAFFGIHSPSTLMFEIGGNIVQGFIDGILALVGMVVEVATMIATNFMAGFNTVLTFLAETWANITTGFTNFITGFGEGWNLFWAGLGTVVTTAWTALITFLTETWANIQLGWSMFTAAVQAGWDAFWTTVFTLAQTAWTNITTGISSFLSGVKTNWDSMWAAVSKTVSDIWNTVTTFISQKATEIRGNIDTFINNVKAGWEKFWAAVGQTVQKEWTSLVSAIQNFANTIRSNIDSFINTVRTNWDNFWRAVAQTVQNEWNNFTNTIRNFANQIQSVISGFGATVQGIWNGLWATVGAIAQGAWATISGVISSGIANVQAWISSGVANVQSMWSAAWNWVASILSNAWSNIVSGVSNGVNNVMAWINWLPGAIGGALGGMAGQLWSIGVQMIQGLANGIAAMAGNVIAMVSNVVGGAVNWARRLLGIASPSKVFALMGNQTGQGFANGIADMSGRVKSAVETIADAATSAIDKSAMFVAGVDAAAGIAAGLESAKGKVEGVLGGMSLTGDMGTPVIPVRAVNNQPNPDGYVGGPQTINQFAEGSIVQNTKVEDPTLAAKKLLDEIVGL